MPEALLSAIGAPRDVAAIDIGSNSVRLVLYRLEGRAIWTVFNEKVLAGLGRDLAETGRLSVEGSAQALTALKRFAAVIEGVQPAHTFVAATAAVRDAADGQTFCDRVAAATGLKIRVLSGEEGARYAALGVLAGIPCADGMVGDLGGSSLELVRLADGRPARGVTLPLGPFALADASGFDPDRLRETIAGRLEPVGDARADTLYAVGGAWRTLAQVHMEITGYPLRVVHQYEIDAADLIDTARLIARSSKASLEKWPGLSRKRADTLPYAALVLEGLIERLGLKRIVLSAWGVREVAGSAGHASGLDHTAAGGPAAGVRSRPRWPAGRCRLPPCGPRGPAAPRSPGRTGIRSGPARADSGPEPCRTRLSGGCGQRPLRRRRHNTGAQDRGPSP